MTGITTDYDNRLVDVELLQSVTAPSAIQRVFVTSIGSEPKIVTGIQKAAQRYAVLLLTTIGDVRFAEDMGGQLVVRLVHGSIQNMGYLRHIFSMANSNALRMLKADDESDTYGAIPDDERIVKAVLQDAAMDYSAGTLSLEVRLTTAAGDAFSFVVPINTAR